MPHLLVASAAGTSLRRLVYETTAKEKADGYPLAIRREGGEWKELLTGESGGGLFDVRRLVLVEEAHLLGKFPPGMEPLLEGPECPVHILLVFSEDARSTFPKDILPRLTWLKGEEIPRFGFARQKWFESEARRHGLAFSGEAKNLLLDSMEDPEEILSELSKLRLVAEGGRVGVELVRLLCFDEGEKALLSLLDGMCDADISRVATALPQVKRRDLIPVAAALHNRFRLALYHASFKGSHKGKAAAEALKARPYQERQALEAVRNFSRAALSIFVRDLCAVNIGEKSGNRRGWVDLELAILDLLGSLKAQV